jgi:putative cardiolipin synthase
MLDARPCPYPLDGDAAGQRTWLEGLVSGLVWAPARVVADEPGELTRGRRGEVAAALVDQMAAAEREILVESAYFVHRKAGVEAARRVREAGVRVRVLTNSLASNDVMLAHAGYEKHRKGLLEAGVELHELRPDARTVRDQVAPQAAGAVTSLHTKAVVLDRKWVFIGSFNLDLRSAELNTEVALLIDSPGLAAAVAAFMDEGAAPASSFRVVLGEDGSLVWTAADEDGERRWSHEPETSGWQRFAADLVRLLPIQSQL